MFVVIKVSIKQKRLNATAKSLFFVYILLLSNWCKLTETVADIVITRTENRFVCAIKKSQKLVFGRVEVTINHLDFVVNAKAGPKLSFAAGDLFDWFNVCVHWNFIFQYICFRSTNFFMQKLVP